MVSPRNDKDYDSNFEIILLALAPQTVEACFSGAALHLPLDAFQGEAKKGVAETCLSTGGEARLPGHDAL
jgi:hypothetical protein